MSLNIRLLMTLILTVGTYERHFACSGSPIRLLLSGFSRLSCIGKRAALRKQCEACYPRRIPAQEGFTIT